MASRVCCVGGAVIMHRSVRTLGPRSATPQSSPRSHRKAHHSAIHVTAKRAKPRSARAKPQRRNATACPLGARPLTPPAPPTWPAGAAVAPSTASQIRSPAGSQQSSGHASRRSLNRARLAVVIAPPTPARPISIPAGYNLDHGTDLGGSSSTTCDQSADHGAMGRAMPASTADPETVNGLDTRKGPYSRRRTSPPGLAVHQSQDMVDKNIVQASIAARYPAYFTMGSTKLAAARRSL